MYHGKYGQGHTESRVRDNAAQWWLTAGCCGLVVTMAFVAFTLWLGMEGPRRAEPTSADFGYNRPPPVYRLPEEPRNIVRPSRGKVEKVHKDEEEKEDKNPTHLNLPIPQAPVVHKDEEELRTYQGTLDHGEELLRETGVKESNIKKKSEAVFPSGYDPDFYLPPRVFSHIDTRREETPNDFVHHTKPEIPPFTYIKDAPVSVEERIDNAVNNYFSYPETAEGYAESDSSLVVLLRKKLVDVKDWLMARGDQDTNSDWVQLISTFNQSIAHRNLTTIISKLKDMYNSTDVADVPVSSILYPDSQNGSSLLSFGLLAVDLFLLHNVQQIAWNEEARLGDQMLDDPEVVAMNALFLSPDRVKQLRQKGSRVLKTEEGGKGMLTEALEFVNSMLRAILNLNKAYRSSAAAGRSRQTGPSTMDCIWTLYCRNLDKTAKLQGPYGFLAKMNR